MWLINAQHHMYVRGLTYMLTSTSDRSSSSAGRRLRGSDVDHLLLAGIDPGRRICAFERISMQLALQGSGSRCASQRAHGPGEAAHEPCTGTRVRTFARLPAAKGRPRTCPPARPRPVGMHPSPTCGRGSCQWPSLVARPRHSGSNRRMQRRSTHSGPYLPPPRRHREGNNAVEG
jgi:hypothetical protein